MHFKYLKHNGLILIKIMAVGKSVSLAPKPRNDALFSFAWQTFTICFICLKWLNLETKLGIVWPKIFLWHGKEKNPSASITLFPLLVVFSGNIPGFSKRLAFSHANYHTIPDISQKRLISSSWPPSLMKGSQGLFLSSFFCKSGAFNVSQHYQSL